jgi:hypothetical protein
MKYKYTGTDERVFPSLGIVVKPNEEFDAPDNFSAADVTLAGAKVSTQTTKPTEPTTSAASDTTVGE